MFDYKILKPIVIAAAIALPGAAGAVTLVPSPGGPNLLTAYETYDAALNPISPVPDGSITYDFSIGVVPVALFGDVDVDVSPGASLTEFCAFWSTGPGGCTGALTSPGTSTGNIDLSIAFAAPAYTVGDIVSLTISWTGVTASPIGSLVADFQFDAISIVPVPASGFLLLGGLGGLAALRRRRKKS